MAKDQVTTVKDAVYKLQLALLEGITDQNQLFAAGSLMSQGDYQDVVTERTIGNMCGYPLCGNSLPSERPYKGRYHISLKEHKVYDLQETYMYCSTNCVVNSRTFGSSLPAERCSVFNTSKINEILRLFKNKSFDLAEEETMGRYGNLGFSKLEIQEKTKTKGGEVSLDDWIGPSNAIEGYVPKGDRNVKPSHSKAYKKGSESNNSKLNVANSVASKDRDFESEILTEDACATSKTIHVKNDESFELLPSKATKCLPSKTEYKSTIMTEDKYGGSVKPLQDRSGNLQSNKSKQGHKPKRSNQKKEKDTNFFNMDFMGALITQDEYSVSKPPSGGSRNDGDQTFKGPNGKGIQKDAEDKSLALQRSSTALQIDSKKTLVDSTTLQKHTSLDDKIGLAKSSVYPDQSHEDPGGSSCLSTVVLHSGEAVGPSKTSTTRSSLKSSTVKKSGRRVSWADENETGCDGRDLCEVKELSKTDEASGTLGSAEVGENDSSRFASAKAIAVALSEAAEAVASGQSYVTDAVSEVGIVLLPQAPDATASEHTGEVDAVESEKGPLKWPKKSDISSTDVFDSERSWFDLPPEGFSLTLSPFATMWNALFTWMTCSSLAYIYGKDDSLHEEYLCVNGREYLKKLTLPDGRSSEIKQTMAVCLDRALASVNDDFKLATPLSTLEKGLGCLLETMSFVEALPSFRMKQWQAIVLLFIEALSVHRIPGLAPQLTSKRCLIPKVLDGAQMSMEEFQFLKDIVLPHSPEA